MPEETLIAETGIFKAIDGDNWERPFWTWHRMEFCGLSDGLSYLGFIRWWHHCLRWFKFFSRTLFAEYFWYLLLFSCSNPQLKTNLVFNIIDKAKNIVRFLIAIFPKFDYSYLDILLVWFLWDDLLLLIFFLNTYMCPDFHWSIALFQLHVLQV